MTGVQTCALPIYHGIESMTLSPNPTHGLVNILGPKSDVTIYDQLGQIVLQKANTKTFDLTGHPKGVYFVTLSNEQGTITIKTIRN